MVVENHVEVAATPTAVCVRVVAPEGINHEMRPWMTMSLPGGTEELNLYTIPHGKQ